MSDTKNDLSVEEVRQTHQILTDASTNFLALQAVWACKSFLREMAQPFTHEDQLEGRALLTAEQV